MLIDLCDVSKFCVQMLKKLLEFWNSHLFKENVTHSPWLQNNKSRIHFIFMDLLFLSGGNQQQAISKNSPQAF